MNTNPLNNMQELKFMQELKIQSQVSFYLSPVKIFFYISTPPHVTYLMLAFMNTIYLILFCCCWIIRDL